MSCCGGRPAAAVARQGGAQLGPAADAELGVGAGQVDLDRAAADEQLGADLGVRAAGGGLLADPPLGDRQGAAALAAAARDAGELLPGADGPGVGAARGEQRGGVLERGAGGVLSAQAALRLAHGGEDAGELERVADPLGAAQGELELVERGVEVAVGAGGQRGSVRRPAEHHGVRGAAGDLAQLAGQGAQRGGGAEPAKGLDEVGR